MTPQIFKSKPESSEPKKLRILNLGAGVQSTTVALMIHKGELPPIDCAIFADVQEEPKAIYKHLDWLIKEVASSFPIYIVSAGKLGDGISVGPTHAKGHTSIPAYTLGRRGEMGITRRQCTGDYKIQPIEQFIKRDLLGCSKGKRIPKGTEVTQIFGLSFEELGRAERVKRSFHATGRSKFARPEFPLIEKEMRRGHCIKWMKDYGVPHSVERSACVFCPYKSDKEWQRLKLGDPDDWKRALEVDELLRNGHSRASYGMRNAMYLHKSCKPLGEIDFSTPEERGDQSVMGFLGECQGMCGT